jgi:acyl carrier protein
LKFGLGALSYSDNARPDWAIEGRFTAFSVRRYTNRSFKQEGSGMPGIEDKVKQIIIDQLSVEESDVTPTASFVDDLGADSLDRVELIMALEEAFDMEIPDDQAETIKTVQDAVAYIEKNSKVVKQ